MFYQGGAPLEGTYCVIPNNNLKLVDFSGVGDWGIILNPIRMIGMVRLEVLNIAGSQLENWIRNLGDFPNLRVLNNRGNRLHLEN